ncbi:MAG: endolytic transglycosylase MltG, partial [Gammaproteobacteria bacterium]|nr:endolytic transglycosylase MltG [Gammaproteobacteria bacterium]
MNRLFIAAGVLLLVGIAFLLTVAWQTNRFMATPLAISGEGVALDIPAGSSFSTVSENLVAANLIPSDFWLRLYVRWHGKASAIQAGDYWVEAGATPMSLLEQLTRGAVRLYAFTIVEGWNHRELMQALQANDSVKVTMTDEDWPALLESLGAAYKHPEGLFLPETYRFPRDTTDRDLLAQAYALMQSVLAEEWANRSADAPVQ